MAPPSLQEERERTEICLQKWNCPIPPITQVCASRSRRTGGVHCRRRSTQPLWVGCGGGKDSSKPRRRSTTHVAAVRQERPCTLLGVIAMKGGRGCNEKERDRARGCAHGGAFVATMRIRCSNSGRDAATKCAGGKGPALLSRRATTMPNSGGTPSPNTGIFRSPSSVVY